MSWMFEHAAHRPQSRRALRGPVRRFLVVLTGVLLLEAAWILVVPPFRGLDEHDHAYKAAAVARGDWQPHHPAAPGGWGEIVEAPRDLVQAAGPVCRSLPYTSPANCSPGEDRGDGLVTVASSASRYNPAFYAVVGLAGLPFDGISSLLAMRSVSALLCALVIATAAVMARQRATTAWPAVAVILALTPTMLYSTSMTAPNGIEMAAALLFWCVLLGVVRKPPQSWEGWLLPAAVSAVLLVTVRSLGPLWLGLICLTLATLIPGDGMRSLLRKRSAYAWALLVLVSMVFAAAWTISAGTNDPRTTAPIKGVGSAWPDIPQQLLLWTFQSLGAFPSRDEMAPLALYAVLLPSVSILIIVAVRMADARERLAMLLIVLLTSSAGIAVTVAVYERLGTAWQGRYAYPFALGLVLVCGSVLERRGFGRAWRWPVPAAVTVAVLSQVIGQVGVLTDQLRHSPVAHTDLWWDPPVALVVLLGVAGGAFLTAGLTPINERPADNLAR